MTTSEPWCAVHFACMLCIGYAGALTIARPRPKIELFALAACLGPIIIGWYLIALSFLGFLPSRLSILILAISSIGIIFLQLRRPVKRPPDRLPKIPIAWVIIGIIALGYGITVIGFDSIISPTIDWDAFAIWQLKAKLLADFPLTPKPEYFSNLNLSFSHLAYPILLPMISAGSMVMSGPARDELGKAPLLLLQSLGLGTTAFSYLRHHTLPAVAVVATSAMLLLPTLLDFGGTGVPETALLAFYAASISSLLRWQDRRHPSDLILTALFSAAMAWTKNEGIALAAINAFVVFTLTPKPFNAKHLLLAATFCAIVLAIFAPWWLYARSIPHTDENYSSRLTVQLIQSHLDRVPMILTAFYKEFTNLRDWNLFWILPAALALLNPTTLKRRPVITLWILLILHITACSAAYLVTNWKLEDLIPVSINRLVLHMAPLAALLIGLQWPRKSINSTRR